MNQHPVALPGTERKRASVGRTRLATSALVVAALVAAAPGLEAPSAVNAGREAAHDLATTARVTITVRLDARGKGTFSLAGGPTDSGRVVATREVKGRLLHTTHRMTGRYGLLVISSSQACARSSGTWKTASGTRSYVEARGGGRSRGRVGCNRPWKPSTAVYTGSLTTPQISVVPSHAQRVLVASTDYTDHGGIATEDSADFNGDGYIDVLITRAHWRTFDTYPLLVLLNDRHGGFVDGTTAIFEGAPPRVQWSRKIVIADFNNDGRPDVFVADHGYDGDPGPGYHNTLVLSTPTGKLRDSTSNLPPRIRFTHSATAADVNADGSLDLYIGSIYTWARKEPPELFLNDGTGRFSACGDCLPALLRDPVIVDGRPLDGYTYTASQFVDIDNDRDPDLVLAGNGFYGPPPNGIVSSDSQVLVNDGTGRFSVHAGALPPRPWNDTAEGHDVRAADLNGDGFQDLAMVYTRMYPLGVGRWIQILVNNGNGTFRDETQARLPQVDNQALFATQVSFHDLTGDGALDLIVELVEGGKEPTPFYVNDGTGTFRPLPAGYGNILDNNFALVDADADGHRDFLTSDVYGFPEIDHYVVHEVDAPRLPGTPTDVRVTREAASGRPVVSWPYVWGAEHYEVWRSTTAGSVGKRIATTRLMRFVDATAAPGTAYEYSVLALNGSGRSKLSQPAGIPQP